MNALMAEAKRAQGNNNASFLENFVKMPEGQGQVVVRFLPPAPSGMFDREKNPFFVASCLHKINGKNLHSPRALNRSTGKWEGDCPFYKHYRALWAKINTLEKSGGDSQEIEELKTIARQIKPIERYYYNVMVRSEQNPETGEMKTNVGPKILSVGKTQHGKIIAAIVGDESAHIDALGDITDPKTGRDFLIYKTLRRTGTEAYPNYDKSRFLDPTPLGDPDEVAKWMENLHDLEAIRKVLSYSELELELKRHLGLVPNEDDYDPSEFGLNKSTNSEPAVEKVQTQTKTETSVETVAKTEEEEMVEDEFLNELKGLDED